MSKYVVQMSKDSGEPYLLLDKTARTQISQEVTAREAAIADLKTALTHIHFINNMSLHFFELSMATLDGRQVYTLTALLKSGYDLYGFGDGQDNSQIHLSYAQGSDNVGTSATEFRYDDTLVSDPCVGFVLLVLDKTDYTLKFVQRNHYQDGQLVIAEIFGFSNPELNRNTGYSGFYGLNSSIFKNPTNIQGMKRVYISNFSESAFNGLHWYKDSDGKYHITKNHDFTVYGYFEDSDGEFYGIGTNDECQYKFPDELVSTMSITGFAMILLSLREYDNQPKIIIAPFIWWSTMRANYAVLGIVYGNDKGEFFSEGAKYMFSNHLENDTNNENLEIGAKADYWKCIHDSICILSGNVNYEPSEHRITFDHVILGPSSVPGNFITNIMNQTVVLDWSDLPHPNYAVDIYYDTKTNQPVYYSTDIDPDDPDDAAWARKYNKVGMPLLCVVYNGKYRFVCGSAQTGTWHVNGVDIYSGVPGSDLYKAFKKVGVVGDSLSVGYMYNKATGTATGRMLEYSWPKVVMRDAGGAPWLNIGTSGQNVLTWCSNDTYGKAQAEAEGNKCQAYIIGLGENDQSDSIRGCPLGSPSDIVKDYTHVASTYYGGYVRIIEILKHINPDCKIFCLTNPRVGGTGGDGRARYNEAVRYITDTAYADDDNVILLDDAYNYGELFNGSSFLPNDSAAILGGHYSAIGYARIATIMEKMLSEKMETLYSTMYNIAFIPYDTGEPTANTMTE